MAWHHHPGSGPVVPCEVCGVQHRLYPAAEPLRLHRARMLWAHPQDLAAWRRRLHPHRRPGRRED